MKARDLTRFTSENLADVILDSHDMVVDGLRTEECHLSYCSAWKMVVSEEFFQDALDIVNEVLSMEHMFND